MNIRIKAFSNCDDTFIVWKPSERIRDCRGFALYRYRKKTANEKEELVSTWVGFEDDPPSPPGTNKPSTEWPIQRFAWTDFLARPGDKVRYRVIPVCGSKKENEMLPVKSMASAKTAWVKVASKQTAGISAFFNRGIVASQWLSRRLDYIPPSEQRKKLKNIINDPHSRLRRFLAGAIRYELLELLADARTSGGLVYACLYELNDPELIHAIESLGKKIHLILANGSPKPNRPDQNYHEREMLRNSNKINLYDRIVKNPHLAHHKFLVFCDPDGRPLKVWTGSTNWTVTGLCTQANNAIVIDNQKVASWFKDLWELLRNAGNDYPDYLKKSNSKHRKIKIGGTDTTVWFTPIEKEQDLAHARKIIRSAKQGILFLMFNPGPKNTLLNEIVGLTGGRLFIQGVVNVDPGGKKNPVLRLFDRGEEIIPRPEPKIIIPAAINKPLKYWRPELRNYSIAMIHSKVVVVDPFGSNPVVMTGSHNMGPKASKKNDDNLAVIENARGLAAEYAVNIMSIYNQYKWRHSVTTRHESQKWNGLVDRDDWQNWLRRGPRWKEIKFWLGQY
ncbi:MAG: phospholipase D-like domain-containing protein [Nitrososphaera sp.]|nr:phospholipase D-like domain-containing protein [Nitrososphaera sp.]